MNRTSHSLSGIFTRHQLLSVLLIMLLLVSDSLFLYCVEYRNAVSERSYQLQVAAVDTNVRMRIAEESVKDALTTVMYNYDGLWSDENGQKYFDKQKLNRLIVNKQHLISELEYYFAFRPDDFTVFQALDSADIFQRLELKEYLICNASALATTVKKDDWKLITIRDQVYLVLIYYYSFADIYVGIAARPEDILADIISLSNNLGGSICLTSADGNSIQWESPTQHAFGYVRLPSLSLKGNLTLDAEFTVNSLQAIQSNIVGITVASLAVCLIMLALTNALLRKKLIRPLKTISDSVKEMNDFTEPHRVPQTAEVAELQTLENALNTLLEDAVYNRMKLYTIELEKKEQELRMLRSQLRPHFFLNAISTVSSMTYQDRSEDIRDYLLKLSRFLRYIIASSSETVSLTEELENIDNYLEMQSIRYPDRIFSFVSGCDGASRVFLPRFLLLTIVENAFKYGMRMDDVMQILIECTLVDQPDFSGVVISIEDNGSGFTPEQIECYNRPDFQSESSESHIGITNVKKTLALYYGRGDLLKLSNALPNGARIEIRIPWKEGERSANESSDR